MEGSRSEWWERDGLRVSHINHGDNQPNRHGFEALLTSRAAGLEGLGPAYTGNCIAERYLAQRRRPGNIDLSDAKELRGRESEKVSRYL